MTKSKIEIELPCALEITQAMEIREIIRAAMEAYASNNMLVLSHVQRAAYPEVPEGERAILCNAEVVKWRCELARLIGKGFIEHKLIDDTQAQYAAGARQKARSILDSRERVLHEDAVTLAKLVLGER